VFLSWKGLETFPNDISTELNSLSRYNSAVFSSISAVNFSPYLVTEGFINPKSTFTTTNKTAPNLLNYTLEKSKANAIFKRFEPNDCKAAYAARFIEKYGDVLLVTEDIALNSSNPNNYAPVIIPPNCEIPYAWICGDGWNYNPFSMNTTACTLAKAQNGTQWTLYSSLISYYLVQTNETEQCRLNLCLSIMFLVILSNLSKAAVMFLTIWKLTTPTLVTLGDAITSFLDNPDPTTLDMCMATREGRKGQWGAPKAEPWHSKSYYWFESTSIERWLGLTLL